ncbi:MAG: hypothetical protein ACRERE_01065 [Candidatus Entotheonellia bacterium]
MMITQGISPPARGIVLACMVVEGNNWTGVGRVTLGVSFWFSPI